ncbi:copper chaperone PCu(A)C [Rhodococcus rhodochrous]|uniref:Copper chaperone PCu(A)C n=1 Tax=Rhodococcus rhodochrous TaxID=1829 RepID=A0AAW4XEV9_RHORH|nr:copper chaperone PCu(A)C [Rhodococcus rhodochrous]MCD2111152.1 copper chaperone PCu(A)C [Rhodococcus rhodochrous]
MKKTLLCTASVAVAVALFATACGSETTTTSADAVVVADAWVKASDTGMTGAFAEIENTGSNDVHIVGASSPSSASTELHEMVSAEGTSMVMQEMGDGLVVPAGATHALVPGGDHLMLMNLVEPLGPGSTVSFTLEFADGSTEEFTAQVRDFAGAQEEYVPAEGEAHDG